MMTEETAVEVKQRPERLKPRSGLRVQYAAVRALFLRELQTRFGNYRLSYVWFFLEPMSLIVLKLILFGAIMTRAMSGIDYSLFLVAGILPFFMVMRSATKALQAVESNKGLLSYRAVKPIDTVIARVLLEGLLYFSASVVMLSILIFAGLSVSFSHIPFLFGTWLLLLLFSFGLALIMSVIGDLSADLTKFIQATFFVLYFLSGVIYSINQVPVEYHHLLLWNPILHGLDFIRHALAPDYPVRYVSYNYLLLSTMTVLFFGLLMYRGREQKMMTSR